jgi:hypothetical protein
MIHYQLQCGAGHGFDGWFKDSGAFDKQAARGLLVCPVCGDAKVERALMTPSVPRKANARSEPVVAPPPAPAPERPAAPAPATLAGRMPDHVRAMLQKLRAEVEKSCDYVGNDFPDEARRMHRGESEHRGIYGEANPSDVDALMEEGIEIARIPWVPRADS